MLRFKDYDILDRMWIVLCFAATVVLASLAAWAVVGIWCRIFGGVA